MACLHREFGQFYARIAMTSGNKVVLRMAREAIRERIRRYFRNTLKVKIPKFRGQGAFDMNTMINSMHGEYDMDDGVYLQHLDHRDDSAWPAAHMVHQWLVNAVEGNDGGRAESRQACVRVRYRGLYRIDLPVYSQLNGQLVLAVKEAPVWLSSDPLAFSLWFERHVQRCGEQLRRIVCYLKAWADFQTKRWGDMPGGMIITILAVRHFQKHETDDLSLAYTLNGISNAICPVFYVPNPVDLNEELTVRLKQVDRKRFQYATKAAAQAAIAATAMQNADHSMQVWHNLLGNGFYLDPHRNTPSFR